MHEQRDCSARDEDLHEIRFLRDCSLHCCYAHKLRSFTFTPDFLNSGFFAKTKTIMLYVTIIPNVAFLFAWPIYVFVDKLAKNQLRVCYNCDTVSTSDMIT